MLFIKEKIHAFGKNYEIKKHQLEYLFLEITSKCNLSCLHCGSDCKSNSEALQLTTDSWIEIINHINTVFGNSVRIIITGGEPLMHPNLDIIVQHINSLGFKYGMVSNGFLFDNAKMEMLTNNKLYSLTISLDGLTEAHNYLRNSPIAFEKAISAIELGVKSNIPFTDVVTCVYPKNLNELNDVAELLIAKGVKNWRLFRIFPSGRAAKNPEIQLSFEQTQEMLAWIKENKKIYKKRGLNLNLSCEGWLPFADDIKVRDYPFFCRSGVNIASILSDGSITGCSNNHESFTQGNVLRDNFGYIWNERFGAFRQRKWLHKTKCNRCKHFDACQGSSIHLWELGDRQPKFCYVVDFDKKTL